VFKKQRETGPDYAGLSKVAMTAETAVKNAATAAKAKVAQAAIKATSDAKFGALRAERDIKRNDQKIEQRKAGILPAIGQIIGKAFEKDPKRPPPQILVEPVRPEKIEYPTAPRPTKPEMPTFEELDLSSTSTGSTYQGIPRTADDSSGTSFSQVQLKQLLLDQGMNEKDATLGAAIGMAESGGNPNARSHPDLEARTGEMSLGLWQHNANTGEDRHDFYGIKDWNELKDPQTNARATYRLWKRRGGWGDWGAYTDGSYKKYY
jgi:hypothetical protein